MARITPSISLSTSLFQGLGTLCVVFFLFQVLTTVHFDNEFLTWRAEIYDVITDGMLAAKANIVQFFIARLYITRMVFPHFWSLKWGDGRGVFLSVLC